MHKTYRVAHLVTDNLLLTSNWELHTTFVLQRNLKFDVNKQCSATRWATLYAKSGGKYFPRHGFLYPTL